MPTTSELLATAVEHHQAGRLQVAEEIYRQILAREPQHADAIHLVGLVVLQTGQHGRAVDGSAVRLRSAAIGPTFTAIWARHIAPWEEHPRPSHATAARWK